MNDERTNRYARLAGLDEFQTLPITIMGLGSVGRPLARMLATMGATNLTLYDPDTIEESNLGSQGWSHRDIGLSKVDVVSREITDGNLDTFVNAIPTKRPLRPIECDVLFCCIDNMADRISLSRSNSKPRQLLIDTRIGFLTVKIFGDSPPFSVWRSSLFTDAESDDAPCALRVTQFTANLAASWAAATLFNYLRDKQNGLVYPTEFRHNTMDFTLIRTRHRAKRLVAPAFNTYFDAPLHLVNAGFIKTALRRLVS